MKTQNAFILPPQIVTLSVPLAAASQLVSEANLLDSKRSKIMRTSGTSQTITATTQSGINCAVLLGKNLTNDAHCELVVKSGAQTVFNLSQLVIGQWFCFTFDAVEGDSIRFVVNDPTNPDGYMEFYRIAAGMAYRPQWNVSLGLTIQNSDSSTVSGDSRTTSPGVRRRKIGGEWAFLTRDDRNKLSIIINKLGKTIPAFFCFYPPADWGRDRLVQDGMVFARFADVPIISHTAPELFKTSFKLEQE